MGVPWDLSLERTVSTSSGNGMEWNISECPASDLFLCMASIRRSRESRYIIAHHFYMERVFDTG